MAKTKARGATGKAAEEMVHILELTEHALEGDGLRRFEWRLPWGLVVIRSVATGRTEKGLARDCEGKLVKLNAEEMRHEIVGVAGATWISWRTVPTGEERADAKDKKSLEADLTRFRDATGINVTCGPHGLPCGHKKKYRCYRTSHGECVCSCLGAQT